MSATFTIRIPRKLKERMEKNPVQWSREVRSFLEERVKQIELTKTLKELELRTEQRKTETDSAVLIREDRERRS